jgi:2-oxoglutarate ferredoxin oxidoreductase subunit delta
MGGKIVVDEERCKGCQLCITVCPFHLIQVSDNINSKGYHPAKFVDLERKCTGCTLCALTCPEIAIEVYREEKPIGDEMYG